MSGTLASCTCPNCGTSFVPRKAAVAKRQPRVSRPQRTPNDRSKMWQAMRILREFSAQSIAATTKTAVRSARNYINALISAGYVISVKPTRFEVGDYTVYRLTVNTGPLAPRVRADGKSLLDLNTNTEVPRAN